jgi:hypothetical protein
MSGLGVGLEKTPKELLILIRKLGVHIPAGLIGRNGILLHPAATGEFVKICTWLYGSIQRREVQAGRVRHGLERLRRRLGTLLGEGPRCGKKAGTH